MRVLPPVSALTLALATLSTVALAAPAQAAGHSTLFVSSAVEHADHTVTLPVHRGEADGQTFWFVVLDASTSNAAQRFGVNRSNKLSNVGAAAQAGHYVNGVLQVGAGVDFTPDRDVVGGSRARCATPATARSCGCGTARSSTPRRSPTPPASTTRSSASRR